MNENEIKDNNPADNEVEKEQAPLKVVDYQDPVLRRTCVKVKFLDDETRKLIDEMAETMLISDGIGLAAPQVGVNKRFFLFVSDFNSYDDEDNTIEVKVAINPQILEREGEYITYEGCLSYPEYFAHVRRAVKIKVRYHDLDMNRIEEEFSGLAARVFQHELDHLDGILFIDRMEAGSLKHSSELDEKEDEEATETASI